MGLKIAAQRRSSKRASLARAKTPSSTRFRPPGFHLQRTIGNSATSRLFRAGHIQAKLTVSKPGDASEREADRVAGEVMRMPEPQPGLTVQGSPLNIQRKCTKCEEEHKGQPVPDEEEKSVQAKPEGTPAAPGVSGGLESYLNTSRGAGQPLPPSARAYFEPRFGRDFSDVRVHTDRQASQAANAIAARAFTSGQNIVFGVGQYAPESKQGRTLLAHELTHVVQQHQGSVATLQGEGPNSEVLHSIQRDPQASQTIRRDDKPKSDPPKAKNLYFAVGDNSLNLGGGVFVKDMESLKAALLNTTGEGGTWTLSMTMHGADTFFGLSSGDVTGGLTENDPQAYNKNRVQQIFGDATFQAWRKKHGPKGINLLSCQIGKDLEAAFRQLIQHPTSTQRAVGLGQGCILINTPIEATFNGKHIRTREQYNKLGDTGKQTVDKTLKDLNDAYGYNGEKIKPGEILNQYFDEAPEGLWVRVEVLTPSRKKVSYMKRTAEKAFIDECQPSQGLKQRQPTAPVPADESE